MIRKILKITYVSRWTYRKHDRSAHLLVPPFPRRNHFYFFQIPKKSELRTHLKSDFEGYPQKSFTKNTSVLKMGLLKKGGGGTLPYFALNEGRSRMMKMLLKSCFSVVSLDFHRF